MTYEEVCTLNKPFNRKCYNDGWYLHDEERKVDWSVTDLSIRLWTNRDLIATDWIIEGEFKND